MAESVYLMYKWTLGSYHLEKFGHTVLDGFYIMHLHCIVPQIEIVNPRIKYIP
jgi:hypothetical protein